MTPSEARQAQTQRPRLPDGWGATLSTPLLWPKIPDRKAETVPAVALPRLYAERQNSTPSTLLATMERLADAGEALPYCAALADLIGAGERTVRDALARLETTGRIRIRVIRVGGGSIPQEREITLVATGLALQTARWAEVQSPRCGRPR